MKSWQLILLAVGSASLLSSCADVSFDESPLTAEDINNSHDIMYANRILPYYPFRSRASNLVRAEAVGGYVEYPDAPAQVSGTLEQQAAAYGLLPSAPNPKSWATKAANFYTEQNIREVNFRSTINWAWTYLPVTSGLTQQMAYDQIVAKVQAAVKKALASQNLQIVESAMTDRRIFKNDPPQNFLWTVTLKNEQLGCPQPFSLSSINLRMEQFHYPKNSCVFRFNFNSMWGLKPIQIPKWRDAGTPQAWATENWSAEIFQGHANGKSFDAAKIYLAIAESFAGRGFMYIAQNQGNSIPAPFTAEGSRIQLFVKPSQIVHGEIR